MKPVDTWSLPSGKHDIWEKEVPVPAIFIHYSLQHPLQALGELLNKPMSLGVVD